MSAEFDFREYDDQPIRLGPFTITVARVAHPVVAYGLRVESSSGVLVYSGDTGPCQPLVDLARGADLLLAESAFVEGGDNPAGPAPDRQAGRGRRRRGRGPSAGAHPHPALARRRGLPGGGARVLRRPAGGCRTGATYTV